MAGVFLTSCYSFAFIVIRLPGGFLRFIRHALPRSNDLPSQSSISNLPAPAPTYIYMTPSPAPVTPINTTNPVVVSDNSLDRS